MPARAERVSIYPDKNGEPGLILPFPAWWNRDEFFKRFKQREVDTGNPIDANYTFTLTSREAVAWNEECKNRFMSTSRSTKQEVLDAMRRLELAISKSSRVIVESYEWESGMD